MTDPAMRLTQADLTPCPECGAAYYGNASCLRCHRQWARLWGHQCDLCRHAGMGEPPDTSEEQPT